MKGVRCGGLQQGVGVVAGGWGPLLGIVVLVGSLFGLQLRYDFFILYSWWRCSWLCAGLLVLFALANRLGNANGLRWGGLHRSWVIVYAAWLLLLLLLFEACSL